MSFDQKYILFGIISANFTTKIEVINNLPSMKINQPRSVHIVYNRDTKVHMPFSTAINFMWWDAWRQNLILRSGITSSPQPCRILKIQQVENDKTKKKTGRKERKGWITDLSAFF